MINNKISNLLININQTILNALKKFDKNRINFLIVINSKNQFQGVISISDIRRVLIKGIAISSKIKKFINVNPFFLRNSNKRNLIKQIHFYNKNINIDPYIIPVINNKNIPVDIIDNENFNYFSKVKKNKKKILIIGGAGYIGSMLTELLLKKGFNVSVFDKFIYQTEKNFKDIFKNKNLSIFKGDTRHLNTIFNLVKTNDIIIHLGEMVGDPLCEKNPDLTFETNYLASIGIANICKILEVSKFVYVSSCSVYGESSSNELLNESSDINPVSAYARLKIMCEEAILKNIGNFCNTTILRLGTVFGDSHRKRYDLVINLFSGLAATEKPIKIFGGNQWRPFIHIKDVCNFINKIIISKNQKKNGQVFNLVGENTTIVKVGNYIKKKYGTKIIMDDKVSDFRNYKVSSKKAIKIFNYKPKYSIKYGIDEIIKKTKKRKINNIFKKKYINLSNLKRFEK
jgi:nucleoside-diphosphate-sugar epimerase